MSDFDNPEIYRSILFSLPTGVYLVDRNRKIIFWNNGAEEITGYLRQDVVGHFLRDHLLASSSEIKKGIDVDPTDPLSAVFRDGKSTNVNVAILHKEGYRLPIMLQTIPIRNDRGAIIGAAECFERSITALERSRRQNAVAELGLLDGITGVPNRAYMEGRLTDNLKSFTDRKVPFGIMIIEADQLEHLHSTRGPAIVPAILRVVAQTVANSLRPSDFVGRWYENQFLAVLMDCKEHEVIKVADRIRSMVAQSEIEWWGDSIPISAAFGGAGCKEGDTMEDLIERAEQSLTQSIASGGNRVTVLD